MRMFRSNKRLYWLSEIKSWVSMILFFVMLVWIYQCFWAISRDQIIVAGAVVLMLNISRTVNRNFVTAIGFDAQQNEISFLSKIVISGEKTKKYDLSQAKVTLIKNEGISRFFFTPYKITISLAANEIYVITERDGFSYETLSLLRDAIAYETVKHQR
jgi:hypothetical protein